MRSSNLSTGRGEPACQPVARHFPHARTQAAKALDGLLARPLGPSDRPFLQALYASTREAEMAASGWSTDAKHRFLTQQFDLQHCYYQAHHAEASFLLLLREGHPIGRLYWWAEGNEAALIDVSLVCGERGRGVGGALLALLTSQADRLGQAIGLHVEPDNRAYRLYRRFGFEVLADNGVYARMRRPAAAATDLQGTLS